jgi:hypothetical protein
MLSSTLKNILENQKHKCDREKEVKQKILNIVLEKIKNYNTYGNTFCTFKVPPFVLGYIAYNHESMTRYLISKFYKEGFYIIEISKNVIYLSWSIHDIQKVQDEKRKEKLKKINLKDTESKRNNDLISFASKNKLR